MINRTIDGFNYYMYPIDRKTFLKLNRELTVSKSSGEYYKFELGEHSYSTKDIVAIGNVDIDDKKDVAFLKTMFHKERGELYMPKDYNPADHTGLSNKDIIVSDHRLYYQFKHNSIGNPDYMIIVREVGVKGRHNLFF